MITSTISSKGQITVPKEIREHLHVEVSDKIVFIPQEDGKVVITNIQKSASSLFGMLKHRKPEKAISLEKIDAAIRKRRVHRMK